MLNWHQNYAKVIIRITFPVKPGEGFMQVTGFK
jgi:hypothetical protein